MLTNLSLFSGAGGLDLGAQLVGGIRTVCYVEWEKYAQAVLMSRMRERSIDTAPIWDDVQTFNGVPWRGKVDIVSGGFPCQDISQVGDQAGIGEGTRSGLWKEFARIIHEVRPRFVLVENVSGLLVYGQLGIVLGDLARMGFDAQWEKLSARSIGAPHQRERVWIVANARCNGMARPSSSSSLGSTIRKNGEGPFRWEDYKGDMLGWIEAQLTRPGYGGRGEPLFIRMEDGLASFVDRLRLCGNGVVPKQSAPAWERIKEISGQK